MSYHPSEGDQFIRTLKREAEQQPEIAPMLQYVMKILIQISDQIDSLQLTYQQQGHKFDQEKLNSVAQKFKVYYFHQLIKGIVSTFSMEPRSLASMLIQGQGVILSTDEAERQEEVRQLQDEYENRPFSIDDEISSFARNTVYYLVTVYGLGRSQLEPQDRIEMYKNQFTRILNELKKKFPDEIESRIPSGFGVNSQTIRFWFRQA